MLLSIYLVSPVAIYGDGRAGGPTAASLVVEGDLDLDEFADLAWFDGYQITSVGGHAYDF